MMRFQNILVTGFPHAIPRQKIPFVVAMRNDNFYVGNLDTFQAPHEGSGIYKVTPGGKISIFATGFNMTLRIAFDKADGL